MIRLRAAGRPAGAALLAPLAALIVAGCTAAHGATAPTWIPKPSFQGDGGANGAVPGLPVPTEPNPAPSTDGPGSSPPSSGSTTSATDPAVVATNLAAPIGLAVLPDNTALVGERTTGRIVIVQAEPGQPVRTVRTLTGLDTTGDGGLLDLALSPDYSQDNLIYAYITTPTDNRIVDFTLTGPVTPVFTGIPRGTSGNGGRITFGDDGDLYVATGDAGNDRAAADPHSLAGKVLRLTDIGSPAPDNPTRDSAVFTSGHHDPAGICADTGTGLILEVEAADTGGDYPVNLLDPGHSYGWPSADAQFEGPISTLPSGRGGPGGCTIDSGLLYVTSLGGQALLAARITGSASGTLSTGRFTTLLPGKYGRLKTVVAAADGALWLTTSNKDGHGNPVPADERVLRITPDAGGGSQPV